jgi:hypothetical protein
LSAAQALLLSIFTQAIFIELAPQRYENENDPINHDRSALQIRRIGSSYMIHIHSSNAISTIYAKLGSSNWSFYQYYLFKSWCLVSALLKPCITGLFYDAYVQLVLELWSESGPTLH